MNNTGIHPKGGPPRLMVQKRLTLSTRPFQTLFNAADDLLNLAIPYFGKIEENRKNYERTGKIVELPRGIWQFDKSLSIGSFILKFAALEALFNCVLEDFQKRELRDLSEDYFVGRLKDIRTKIIKKPFDKCHLATRVYFLATLCTNPETDPRQVFDVTAADWNKFVEIVDIRNSYSHAKSQKIEIVATKSAEKLWLADDSHPDNFWPLTQAPKDHRILNYQIASELNKILNWIVESLKIALKSTVDDTYLGQEIMKIHQD